MTSRSVGVSPTSLSSSPTPEEKFAAFKSKIPYTKDKTAFTRHLRNHILTLVTALSRYDTEAALSLIEPADSDGKL